MRSSGRCFARFIVAINTGAPGNSSSSETQPHAECFAYRQLRTAIARCRLRHVKIPPHFRDARDKKRRARRGDLTNGRGVSTSETAVSASFTDLNNRRRYSEMHFSLCFVSRIRRHYRKKKRGKLQSSVLHARVFYAAHDPSVCPLCVISSTDLVSPRVRKWRGSRILEYPTVCPGPMTHRLREHWIDD